MDISIKLKLIQEGYTLEEINSKSFEQIIETDTYDEFSILSESINSDINYMTNMSVSMLNESGNNKNIFKKFIEWIIQKIRQLKTFILNLFRKRKEEVVKTQLKSLKDKADSSFKPFVIHKNLEKIIYEPDKAIDTLKSIIDKFEDICTDIIDNAHKGYNETITQETDINKLKVIIWKKVTGIEKIPTNNSTQNVIDKLLKKKSSINIESIDHINNIIKFSDSFYDLWKEVNDSLTYYENQLVKLEDFTDDSFKIVKLVCETILQVYPELLNYINSYIRSLSVIEQYL